MCRRDMLEFMHKAAKVADEIMTCFAIGQGLPEDYYKEVAYCIYMALCYCNCVVL